LSRMIFLRDREREYELRISPASMVMGGLLARWSLS
jgi:hypothetical protein